MKDYTQKSEAHVLYKSSNFLKNLQIGLTTFSGFLL